MDYFLEFHWWYVLIGLVLLVKFTGTSKGGLVVKSFREGKPDHIDIEVEDLTIPVGDELEFHLNGKLLAKAEVKRNKEAEFDHWSDENVYFPKINEGDELVIKYQNVDVIKGTFKLD